MVRIVPQQRKGVAEYRGRLVKRDAVLSRIRLSLLRVPFKLIAQGALPQ